MATTKSPPAEGMRRCIGSAKFGIKAHDAPIEDFPAQPSQRDGLGRMCRSDWKAYTSALRKAATDRQPTSASVAEVERARTDKVEAKVAKTSRAKAKPAARREPIPTKTSRKVKTTEVPAEA
jgi:hypothetical protein